MTMGHDNTLLPFFRYGIPVRFFESPPRSRSLGFSTLSPLFTSVAAAVCWMTVGWEGLEVEGVLLAVGMWPDVALQLHIGPWVLGERPRCLRESVGYRGQQTRYVYRYIEM